MNSVKAETGSEPDETGSLDIAYQMKLPAQLRVTVFS
jgi:hypothetical protein